ncbi:MAG: hypothetical protein ACOCWQ_06040 [Nanoarchaeota archaeon]
MINDEEMKVRTMIHLLPHSELQKLARDLQSGGYHLKRLVDKRIQELETSDRGVCAFCGNPLTKNEAPYTLMFGPQDFRKKASFCGIDCLEAFNRNLRNLQEKHLK